MAPGYVPTQGDCLGPIPRKDDAISGFSANPLATEAVG